MMPIGSAGSVSQLGMRRDLRSVNAAISTTRLSVTRMGMGGIHSPGQQRGCLIAIETLPAQRLQGRNQRIIIGQQRVRKSELVELRAPAGPQLREPHVLFEKLAAVQVAAAVEENLACSVKSIDEIAAELIRREDAGGGRQLLHFAGRGH